MGEPGEGRGAPQLRGKTEQLVLSPFAPGDLVSWQSERGRRVGRFVGIVDRGRRRGLAEVAIGGRLMPEERLWVVAGRLRLVAAKGARSGVTESTQRHSDRR
jgi:hypothetical protein